MAIKVLREVKYIGLNDGGASCTFKSLQASPIHSIYISGLGWTLKALGHKVGDTSRRVAGHKSLDTSRSVKVAGDKPMHPSESPGDPLKSLATKLPAIIARSIRALTLYNNDIKYTFIQYKIEYNTSIYLYI